MQLSWVVGGFVGIALPLIPWAGFSVAAAILVVIAGAAASRFDGGPLLLMIAIYLVWSGASESIYSLSSAHANDRASKEELVRLSGTMLFLWSVSGFLVPGIGTALTAVFGTASFILVAIVIAALFCAFTIWRVMRSPRVPAEAAGPFTPLSAQAPLPVPSAEE